VAMNWMTSAEDLQWWAALLWWVTQAAVRDTGDRTAQPPTLVVVLDARCSARCVHGKLDGSTFGGWQILFCGSCDGIVEFNVCVYGIWMVHVWTKVCFLLVV
jgi:hypothetical protein